MKHPLTNVLLIVSFLLLFFTAHAQTVPDKLNAAFQAFQNDPQLRNAISSLYVVDAKTGQVVFDRNGKMGLAPASTLKVITSASAYELLGDGYTYQTKLAYQKSKDGASLILLPSGDPTLGSWRWKATHEEVVLQDMALAVRNLGIKSFSEVIVDNSGWNEEAIPDGWIWQDVGSYYGAGPSKLNWRENQYDVFFKSGAHVGSPVSIVKTVPVLHGYTLKSELTAAAAGTGDNAFIYFPTNAQAGVIRGTIPINESNFDISGAMPSPANQFMGTLADALKSMGVQLPKTVALRDQVKSGQTTSTTFHTITSPPLDSMVYWFNRKSINLYGEALLKTMAYKHRGSGSTDKGVELLQNYWSKHGVPEGELNIVDGSGLSPLNRVTTHAQVSVLQHARKQPWFDGFYKSLPVYNGMKMKSGTIRGVKGYTGYHTGKDGKAYTFSFLVNNYNGSSSALVKKMYKVLDELK